MNTRVGIVSLPSERGTGDLAVLTWPIGPKSCLSPRCFVQLDFGYAVEMICWICNERQATTREHKIKHSDLKSMGIHHRFHVHSAQRVNQIVQSSNSKAIKFPPSLCASCNGSTTQPYDIAWSSLSNVLRRKKSMLIPGRFVRFNEIFPFNTKDGMRDVHLYFVKMLGCEIVEAKIQTSPGISTLATALMTRKSHLSIWLSFGIAKPNLIAKSDLDAAQFGRVDGFDYLASIYFLDGIAIRVRLCSRGLPGEWHPTTGKRFVIADYR